MLIWSPVSLSIPITTALILWFPSIRWQSFSKFPHPNTLLVFSWSVRTILCEIFKDNSSKCHTLNWVKYLWRHRIYSKVGDFKTKLIQSFDILYFVKYEIELQNKTISTKNNTKNNNNNLTTLAKWYKRTVTDSCNNLVIMVLDLNSNCPHWPCQLASNCAMFWLKHMSHRVLVLCWSWHTSWNLTWCLTTEQ